MAIDIVVGLVLGNYLVAHASSLIQDVHEHGAVEVLHVEALRSRVIWLMGHPAGLKSNVYVAQAIGDVVLEFMSWWNVLTSVLSPREPYILAMLGNVIKFMGFTSICGAISDALGVVTIHVNLFYTLLLNLYNGIVLATSSLWKLFRGKKWNTLYVRVDSCQYDIEQLLLGTLAFTILVFLWPTIFAFYGFFTLVQLLVLATRALLMAPIDFLHHFPLFTVLLHLISPLSLPGGIGFSVDLIEAPGQAKEHNVPTEGSSFGTSKPTRTGLTLHSYGMGTEPILSEYMMILKQACTVFSVPDLLKRFVLGERVVPPIAFDSLNSVSNRLVGHLRETSVSIRMHC